MAAAEAGQSQCVQALLALRASLEIADSRGSVSCTTEDSRAQPW